MRGDTLDEDISQVVGAEHAPADLLEVLEASPALQRYDAENKKFCDPSYSATLAAKGSKNSSKTGYMKDHNHIIPEGRIRRLLPLECERLMSWPDNWTAKGRKEDGTIYDISDTQRYKECGNGLVSDVVMHIVMELYK